MFSKCPNCNKNNFTPEENKLSINLECKKCKKTYLNPNIIYSLKAFGFLLLFFLLVSIYVNFNTKKENNLNNQYSTNSSFNENKNIYNSLSSEDEEQIKKVLLETKNLLDELLNFKNKKDFRYYGFGGDYKYNEWLKKTQELKQSPYDKIILLRYGFALGDLEMLGLEYVRTKGLESEYSEWAKDRIKNGVSQK